MYFELLVSKYPRANVDWVIDFYQSSDKYSIDTLFAYSNAKTRISEIDSDLKKLEILHRERIALLKQLRDQELATISEATEKKIQSAVAEHRRTWRTIGRVALGAANGLSRAKKSGTYNNAYKSNTRRKAAKECSSDIQCGIGNACLKNYSSLTGYCVRSVNEYGTQTFNLPDLNSIGPKFRSTNDCQYTGCPAGFSCQLSSGACVR